MVVFDGSAESRGYAARLDVTVKSQNPANNTSVVNAKLYIRRVAGLNRFEDWDIWYQLNIDGDVVNHTSRPNLNHYSEAKVMDNDFTITHDSLGKKTINVYGHFDGKKQIDYVPGLASVSGRVTLPDLVPHKVATFSTSTTTLIPESEFTVNLTNHDSSKYNYHLYFEDSSGQTGLSGSVVNGSKIVLDSSWISRAPLSGRLRLYTLYNGNIIGTNTIDVTISKPTGSASPAINSITFTELNTEIGTLLGSKRFLQELSRIQVDVNATGSYGSAIRSYSVGIGQTYSNSRSSIFENIKDAGSITVTVSVEDDRGKYASKQETITILNYSYPSVSITPRRASSTINNVTIASNSTVASVKNATNQELNNQTINYTYREIGTVNWVGGWDYIKNDTRLSIAGSTPYKNGTANVNFDKNKVYEIRAVVTDRFGGTATTLQIVGGEVVTLAYHHDGVGIGKVRTFNNRTVDVASGGVTTDGLYYRNGNTEIQNISLTTANGMAKTIPSLNVNQILITGYWIIDPKLRGNESLPFTTSTYYILHVISLSALVVHQQLYDPSSGMSYTRASNNGAWTPWKIVADVDMVNSIVNNQQTAITQSGLPYGLTATLARKGNMVTLTIPRQIKNLPVYHEDTPARETIPVGYRPAIDTILPVYANTGTTGKIPNMIELKANGQMHFTYVTIGIHAYSGSITYITNDPPLR